MKITTGAVLFGFLLAGQAPAAAGQRFCTATTNALLEACRAEVKDDSFVAKAVCTNVIDEAARAQCLLDARMARAEASDDCRDQREARRELCAALGEDRYDPHFDPASFDADPSNPTSPNPFFPLGIGNHWEYAGGGETISIEVLDETKLIEGVTCLVVRDRVEVGGDVVEDTDDWFGQRKDGTVDYCGEISQSFELFPGDEPQDAELVSVEGSWKAGREGALPGTLFPGSPAVGQVYRQEFAPGNAEDAARVLSTGYAFGADPVLDELVPQALAALLCAAGDCVVTAEFSPLDPGVVEHKYYASGIGLFLEVTPESGEIVQLVDCSFDPLCGTLPTP